MTAFFRSLRGLGVCIILGAGCTLSGTVFADDPIYVQNAPIAVAAPVPQPRSQAEGQAGAPAPCPNCSALAWDIRKDSLLPSGWVLPVGVNLGAARGSNAARGIVVGPEISVVNFEDKHRGFWFGAYADALYDTGASQLRLSIGPEAGWALLGVDGGLVLGAGNGGTHAGVTMRGLLTLGVLAGYVRGGAIFDDKHTSFAEFGVLLKIPYPLTDSLLDGPMAECKKARAANRCAASR